jgi:glycosyltransferase involved in cell wall biosynthesis
MENSYKKQHTGQPWVSFCMTTYKRPEFLRNQIRQLFSQTFTDFTIIISDNDPEASGKKIVDEFNDPRIQYATNEQNLGMVKSFNRSLARATSLYVVMITDDDPVYPDMLQTLYDLTIQYPGYGMYMGGCNIYYTNPEVARSSRAKVGLNSCLVDLPIDTVRTFTGQRFPFAFFKGETGHLLWSNGIVKREIALAVDGMPDFGAPYNTDFGYMVLCGSYEGVILLNRALGHQEVHGANYGFTESDFEKFYITPDAFLSWIMHRLPKKHDYTGLQKLMKEYLGRWAVSYAMSMKKFMDDKNLPDQNFQQFLRKLFQIPYLRKWKMKYKIAVMFPNLFEVLIEIKRRMFDSKK